MLSHLLLAMLVLPPATADGGQPPPRPVVASWLGAFERGPERVALQWTSGGLQLELGRVAVPVDGAWHETVPTFFVRHRVVWLAARRVFQVEEQHNLGARWRFELRLAPDGQRLLKVAPATAESAERILATLVRIR